MISQGNVIEVKIEEEMKKSYIDYAMSVIVGRALPDVRDGLKPVHRRILYSMYELGLVHNKPYKKSARIVGEVLGKYHPHGDTAVYDALVRMVQDFSLRYPLVNGQGNFGSVDGDRPAAMRYTEARLSEIAEELLANIEKNTVDFVPNFDDSLKEPSVLPARIPNLLINGSSGIAVGMATNMAPHNLTEICNAIVMLIDNPGLDINELMTVVKGPDFPTGAFILGNKGITSAYTTGRGTVRIRARATIEEDEHNRSKILITQIPYMVNKSNLLESIANLVKDKKIEDISDLRDESDREGMRIVVELKSSATPEVVLRNLYKHTQLETTFGIINLTIVNGEPRILNLKQLMREFLKHRKKVVIRQTKFDLEKAEKRAHILQGLVIALDNIDAVIKLIKGSTEVKEAKAGLVETFELTEVQAQAILDMRLHRLTALERNKIVDEHEELLKKIEELKSILGSEEKIFEIIKKEILEIKEKYGDDRRTQIIEQEDEINIEDLIAREDMVITRTHRGYIKSIPLSTYRMQRRGGRGVMGMETKGEDTVKDLYIASTHDYMLFFSNKGKVYWLKVYEIPTAGRYSQGKAIVNLLKLSEGEKITATITVKEFSSDRYILFVTKRGRVKKTSLAAYKHPRKDGIRAISLEEGDELVDVELTDGKSEIIISTKYGKAIKFREGDVRPMGRTARGVKGINLRARDEVVGSEVIKKGETIFVVTEHGYGKRTKVEGYPIQSRGGKGVINIIPSVRNGLVIGILSVKDDDEIILTSSKGIVIRVPVKDISVIGRNTQGVKIMNLDKGDSVVALSKVH
ncbi:MAG TPA: DNA gyrase subunit A [Euryarchaeota archaeon]|nr:DNA gyrase subunit A [archaeon BMS3Bbin15]HDL15696.1 DNA gyrase subunit A [Euryarchaeota archaeon]